MENQKHKAAQLRDCVEWRFQDQSGQVVAFDPESNLILEEASVTNRLVKVKINGETYFADTDAKKAFSNISRKEVELLRVDKKGEFIKEQTGTAEDLIQLTEAPLGSLTEVLPACWSDMGDSLHQLVLLDSNSNEYKDVEQKTTSTGLKLNIQKVSADRFKVIGEKRPEEL